MLHIDGVEVPAAFLNGYDPSDFAVLKIAGDNMYPVYHDGDMVLILKTAIPCPGDLAIVQVTDGRLLLGGFEKEGDDRTFRPVDPYQPPIKADTGEMTVLGVPVLLLRTLSIHFFQNKTRCR